MPPRIQPAPQLRGKQLPQIREVLRVSQKVFARALRVTQGYIGWLEVNNRPLQPYLCERIYGMQGLGTFIRDEISRLERKNDWRSSKRFGRRPPFQTLPEPGTACGCGQEKCTLHPVKDGGWPGRGHLWLFQGSLCHRSVYLDAKGKKRPPPNRWDDQRSKVPEEICTRCGRKRELSTKYIKKLDCRFYYRYCRPKDGDPPGFKHAPRITYWDRNSKVEKVPPEILRSVRERHAFTFPVPTCEKLECPQFGNRTQISGTAFRVIKRFKCLGPPVHYVFRALPNGEVAVNLGYGYRWTDPKTGQAREVRRKKAKLLRYPDIPTQLCPVHGVELRKRGSPYKSKRTKTLRWRLECPSDGKRFSYSKKEGLKAGKESRWRRRGRPAEVTKATKRRIKDAAAFAVCGVTQSKMASFLFPDKPKSAYSNTKRFWSQHRQEIEATKECLPLKEAQNTVRSYSAERMVHKIQE